MYDSFRACCQETYEKINSSSARWMNGRRDLSNFNTFPQAVVWKFPLQCFAPPRWRAVTHGAPRLRGPHLGTCVDPGKTRSNLWLSYPQFLDARMSVEYCMYTGPCLLCVYSKGVALPFIIFGPESSFLLADHPATVGALSLAAGCRKRTPGSRKSALCYLVTRRYNCDICT